MADPAPRLERADGRGRPRPRRAIALALVAGMVAAGCSGVRPSEAPPSGCASVPPCGGATIAPTVPVTTKTAGPPNRPSPDRAPGAGRTDAPGVDQVWVPGGTFAMGSIEGSATAPPWARVAFRSEQPAHEVALSRGYWIDATEVTVEAFAAFTAAGGYDDEAVWSTEGWAWRQGQSTANLPRQCTGEQAPAEPQVCVTWFEAEAYAAWRGGRLPTEAEWEFAARGPSSSIYPWGDEFDAALANLDGASGPVAVGSYPGGASWVGALDMAGNAMEWVADWWSATYYRDEVRDDPAGPETGTVKIEKGGWWGPPDGAGAFVARSAFRLDEDPPTYSDHHIGFRIVSDD